MRLLVFLLANISLWAQLSPGPLAKAHSSLEGVAKCTTCHPVGSKDLAPKCLECHKALAERVQAGLGYHAAVTQKSCNECHPDHHGADFDLIYWPEGEAHFDHALTGWKLTGKHQGHACRDCHQTKFTQFQDMPEVLAVSSARTFLGLKADCAACHEDVHKGQLTANCQECHVAEDWHQVSQFDHDRTQFALKGQHQQVDCVKCHQMQAGQPAIFRGLAFQRCTDCHQDPHQGQFQKDCVSCHDEDSFKQARLFNHQSASFTLTGKHQSVECIACHPKPIGQTQRFKPIAHQRCQDCHSDPHRGKLGSNCSECHATQSWQAVVKGSFDHSATAFELKGQHAKVACAKCHQKGLKIPAFGQCLDCHRNEHLGQIRDAKSCESCHSEAGFIPAQFSTHRHQETRFPLEGSHLATPCIDCHVPVQVQTRRTRQFHFANLNCTSCHHSPHAESLAETVSACTGCHSVDSWSESHFDHQVTGFGLVGVHSDLSCQQCHSQIDGDFKGLGRSCQDCHAQPHRDQFPGRACLDCHRQTKWSELALDHNATRFPLEGAHQNLKCMSCHFKNEDGQGSYWVYRPIESECEACHRQE